MAKLSFMKFYPYDWMNDTRALSIEAKGCWIEILCLMWNAKERGIWTGTHEEFARVTGSPWEAAPRILQELAKVATATFDDNKTTLINRRMQREQKEHEYKLNRDKRYRERHKNDAETTPKTLDVRRQTPQDVRPQTTKSTPAEPPKAEASAPSSSALPYKVPDKIKDPAGNCVIWYKLLKLVPKDDRAWDKVHFARTKRSTKQLIEVVGNRELALDCMDQLAAQFTKAGLSWTMETILKHAHEWKQKRGNHDSLAHSPSIYSDPKSVISIERKGSRGGGFASAGATLAGIRGLPPTEPGTPQPDGH